MDFAFGILVKISENLQSAMNAWQDFQLTHIMCPQWGLLQPSELSGSSTKCCRDSKGEAVPMAHST